MEVMMGSSSSSADVAWRLGRIMLKYRPIAPKPVASAGGGGGGSPPAVENSRGKKRKRKAPAGGRRRQKKHSSVITTLPLMPETPERKEEPPPPAAAAAGSASQTSSSSPTSVSSFNVDDAGTARAAAAPRPAWSSVTVEAVTDAWWSYEGMPFGYDVSDTCPAFVSEGFDRGGVVVWANEAYRRMAGAGGVALATEGIAAVPAGVACFTCRVRVRYACERRGKVSMVVPCDVWRLADGMKMVWRLDVKAALCLSSLS